MSRTARAVAALAALAALAIVGACGPRPAPAPPQFLALNRPGELVDVEAAVVPGHITIIDFRADWCGACEVVDARIRAAISGDPRIVVRIVDVGDGATPVAAAYRIRGLPHVLVLDRAGALRHRLVGNDALTAGEIARALADQP